MIVSFINKQIEFQPEDLETTFQFWIKNKIEFPWWFAAYYKTCEQMVHSHRSDIGFPCTKLNHQAGYGCGNVSQRQFDLPGCQSRDSKHFSHYCILCGFKGKNNPEPVHKNHGAFTGINSYHCPFQKAYLQQLQGIETSQFKLTESDIFDIVFESFKQKYKGRVPNFSSLQWETGPMRISDCRAWWEKQEKIGARTDQQLKREEDSAAFWR
jgi:hypothetical protein